jgi:hypothetical protein
MSSLLWVDDSCLGEALFFFDVVICYFHQIVMISVIKLRRVVGLADLHGVNVYRFISRIKLLARASRFWLVSFPFLFGFLDF